MGEIQIFEDEQTELWKHIVGASHFVSLIRRLRDPQSLEYSTLLARKVLCICTHI
jgi:hypothetical protein